MHAGRPSLRHLVLVLLVPRLRARVLTRLEALRSQRPTRAGRTRGRTPGPRGEYPCCIAGANDGPPDGVGGIARYNEVVEAFHDPGAWKALCAKLGPCDWQLGFEPTYLGIGDINGSLNFIFHTSEAAQANPLQAQK